MIYSNFPYNVVAEPSRYSNFVGEIILGDELVNDNHIQISCPTGLIIETGINENVIFHFNEQCTLTIKRYEPDWRNTDDTSWNIPDQLFLMLTGNINSVGNNYKPQCSLGHGLLQTLERNSLSNFKTYMRLNYSVSRNCFWTLGIYKVLTQKPCVIKITPPGPFQNKFLIIRNSEVTEFLETDMELYENIQALNISRDISREDWVTL